METHHINYKIPKEAEGTYFSIPFHVPANLERITVSYQYDGGVVDLGLMGVKEKFLGWSGSARSSIWVGPHSATPGYCMVPITPGEWQILVGAYKIPSNGVEVHYTIEYHLQKYRWLKGDLHMHSDASDGQHDIYTLAKHAIKKNLDFIAVTNHNNYNENFNLPKVSGLTIIPAVEWTHYKGHMNFYGVAAPFNNFIANSNEDMIAIVSKAKEKGALISVCHPRDKGCGYLWQSRDIFDMVEVWNGPMRPTNVDGIKWWHERLLEGRKVPLIGGSDYHRGLFPVLIAHPTTHVYAKSPCVSDILEALKNGHAYVTSSPNGITLNFKADDVMMGDTVPWRDGLTFDITAKGLGVGMKVRLVTSNSVINLQGSSGQVQALPSWKFAYVVILRKILNFERIAAISNPIYIAQK